MLKKYLVLAKFAIGKTPREEAEALHSLITATELHLMEPERWYLRLWSPKVVAEVQSTRLLLGLEENEALNEAMRCGI